MLFERDYNILTKEELDLWEKAEMRLQENKKGGHIITREALIEYQQTLPIAALHKKTLFPNNYIGPHIYKNRDNLLQVVRELRDLLNGGTVEREILNFIRDKSAYFIISLILQGFGYTFGHHKTFLFKEFELPPNYVVDYLIAGSNSEGYHFVFVELEAPTGHITTSNGSFGSSIRKGIKQVEDWDSWLEANYHSIRLVYNKFLGEGKALPNEFWELDKSRIHYMVVAGRRIDYNDKTYRSRRKLKRENNISLIHYDNLLDEAEKLLRVKGFL